MEMKIIVNFGDELKHAKVTKPDYIPVRMNEVVIGTCIIDPNNTFGELIIPDNHAGLNLIKDKIQLNVCGTAVKREGNVITEFKLQSVSVRMKIQ